MDVRLWFVIQNVLKRNIYPSGFGSRKLHRKCLRFRKDETDPLSITSNEFFSSVRSFQRQLNIYGFTRITSGPDKGSYYHELFLRGKGFLTHRMLRRKTGAAGKRENVDKSPSLYSFAAMPTEVSSNQGQVTGIVQRSPPSIAVSYAGGSVGPFLGVRSTPLLHASLHDGAQRITSTPHVLPRHQALLRPNVFGTICAKSHASVPPSFGVYMEGQQHYRRPECPTSLVCLVGGQSGFLAQNPYGSMPHREGFH